MIGAPGPQVDVHSQQLNSQYTWLLMSAGSRLYRFTQRRVSWRKVSRGKSVRFRA